VSAKKTKKNSATEEIARVGGNYAVQGHSRSLTYGDIFRGFYWICYD